MSKGLDAETAELPKDMVRTAISQGDLTHSQLIWSKADHAWKQAREFPDLLPEAKVAPAPERPAAPVAPVARAAAPVARMVAAQAPVPVAARPARAQAAPTVMAASAAKAAAPAVAKSYVVKEEADHAHPMKWVCVVLGTLIVLCSRDKLFSGRAPICPKNRSDPLRRCAGLRPPRRVCSAECHCHSHSGFKKSHRGQPDRFSREPGRQHASQPLQR